MKECRRKERLWDALCQAALTLISFWVIYRFAAGTSPLRPKEYVWDSALFQVIGKLWVDGALPYVDIFDHKGPLLFLVQKIAYHFSNPRLALYILESTMVSVSLCLGYQVMRLKWKQFGSLAGALIMLVFWLPLMEYGNLCETHSMPWTILAVYLQLRWLCADKEKHPWSYALVYGLCFGANVMIRPTNGLIIAAVALVITIDLATRKQFGNIFANAFALIAGMTVTIMPFVVYFGLKDAMSEFIYATWTFNLIYANSLSFAMDMQALRGVLFFITPALMCLLMAGMCALRSCWRLCAVNGLSAVVTLYITLSGVGYAHYFALHVPLILLVLFTIHGIWEQERGWRWLMITAVVGFVVLALRTTVPYAVKNVLYQPTAEETAQEQAYDEMVATLCEQIPPMEHNKVAVCGLQVTDAEVFLNTDIRPVGRYCFLMEWHARADNNVRKHFHKVLQSGDAQWVICRENGGSNEIMRILNEKYELHSAQTWNNTQYALYRWKDE